jgi:hypothetical protein
LYDVDAGDEPLGVDGHAQHDLAPPTGGARLLRIDRVDLVDELRRLRELRRLTRSRCLLERLWLRLELRVRGQRSDEQRSDKTREAWEQALQVHEVP